MMKIPSFFNQTFYSKSFASVHELFAVKLTTGDS